METAVSSSCFEEDRSLFLAALISVEEVAITIIIGKSKFLPANTLVVYSSFWSFLVLSYLLASH